MKDPTAEQIDVPEEGGSPEKLLLHPGFADPGLVTLLP